MPPWSHRKRTNHICLQGLQTHDFPSGDKQCHSLFCTCIICSLWASWQIQAKHKLIKPCKFICNVLHLLRQSMNGSPQQADLTSSTHLRMLSSWIDLAARHCACMGQPHSCCSPYSCPLNIDCPGPNLIFSLSMVALLNGCCLQDPRPCVILVNPEQIWLR